MTTRPHGLGTRTPALLSCRLSLFPPLCNRVLIVGARIISFVALLACLLVPAAVKADPTPAPAQAPQPRIDLEPGLFLGAALRLGDAPNLDVVERAGLSFGASAMITPEPIFSLGLSLEHTDLGRERSGVGSSGTLSVTRDLNQIWAMLRLNLLRHHLFSAGLTIGTGLLWQSADASGVLFPGLGVEPRPFTCSGNDSANFGFRAGLDTSLALGRYLRLTAGIGLDNLRLSSDGLDGCAPGAGSIAVFNVRGGLAARFDLSRAGAGS